MERTRKIGVVISAVSLACLILSAYGLVITTLMLYNEGNISNLNAYAESTCTTPVTTINWGDLNVSSTNTKTIWLKKTVSQSLTLNMTTKNWSPANATDYMAVSWNKNIMTAQVEIATITLTVFSNATWMSNFAFDIVITGTG
jgi:hypothetical protein